MSQTLVAGTVGEWTSKNFRCVVIVEKYGIDFHNDADESLEDVCTRRGLSFAQVAAELDKAAQPRLAAQLDWDSMSARELIAHIIERHHEYLKLELPRLRARLDRMAAKHGERDGALLKRLLPVYATLQAELELHLHKEEFILFPVIERYAAVISSGAPGFQPPFGSVMNPIHMMEHEHSSAIGALRQMREITRDYVPADYACANFKAVFHSLEELEADLLQHIHLENDILHPRAAALEKALLG